MAAAPAQVPDRVDDLVRTIVERSPLYRGGFIDLAQAIQDAARDQHIAVVASHPDDPYLMLAARQRSFGYRVTAILATRGEGGQNSTGPETGERLGRLRTLETEAAASMLGFDVHYLDLLDEGYCRTAEEALEQWGRRNATERLARAIRSVRPDVLLTTHHPDERHGHDLGLLEVLEPAIVKAADPAWSSPGLAPHAVIRSFRGNADDEAPGLTFDMTAVDPIHARSFRELAYQVLTTTHRSQSPFRPRDSLFEAEIGLVPIGPRPSDRDVGWLFAGVPGLWDELADGTVGRQLGDDIGELTNLISRPRELARRAIDLRRRLIEVAAEEDLPGSARIRLEQRLRALERVILHAVGIRVALTDAQSQPAIRGIHLDLDLTVHCGKVFAESVVTAWTERRGMAEMQVAPMTRAPRIFEGAEDGGRLDEAIPLDRGETTRLTLRVLPRSRTPAIFDPERYNRTATFSMPLELGLRVVLPGDRLPMSFSMELPTDVRPGVDIKVDPDAFLIPNGVSTVPFNVRITRLPGAPDPREALDLDTRAGILVTPTRPRPRLRPPEGYWEQLFTMRIDDSLDPGVSRLGVRLGRRTLRAPIARIDCDIPDDLRIGLIRGVDDTTSNVLRSLRGAVDLVALGPEELPTRRLDDLDTVIVDVRALAHNKAAKAAFGRLLDFARAGGRLLVFYHKDSEFNVEESRFRGFPQDSYMHIGKGRVTREDAPVTLRDPDHPIFRIPNRIRPGDWDGWKQERGLYFPDQWSADFTGLLAMRDPGQPLETGALLYARLGKGEYVYCALSLYRQLKRQNPGAARLFVNLITPLRRRAERD